MEEKYYRIIDENYSDNHKASFLTLKGKKLEMLCGDLDISEMGLSIKKNGRLYVKKGYQVKRINEESFLASGIAYLLMKLIPKVLKEIDRDVKGIGGGSKKSKHQ